MKKNHRIQSEFESQLDKSILIVYILLMSLNKIKLET